MEDGQSKVEYIWDTVPRTNKSPRKETTITSNGRIKIDTMNWEDPDVSVIAGREDFPH